MVKIILFMIMALCLVGFVSAAETSGNQTFGKLSQVILSVADFVSCSLGMISVGTGLNPCFVGDYITSPVQKAASDIAKRMSETNARGDVQYDENQIKYELQKKALNEQISTGWAIIVALFKLIFDIALLLVLVLEMRLLLYVLFQLIPDIFIKIRDALVNFAVMRHKT